MILFHKPTFGELAFRAQLLGDEATMSYNRAWGGTIAFPESDWADWYDYWIARPEGKRFYRYLMDEDGIFVGEVAYHWDETDCIYMADVIVYAPFRAKGYGREGLRLLCMAAWENGIDVLYDDIAKDNPAIRLFLNEGFEIETEKEMTFLLKKKLK